MIKDWSKYQKDIFDTYRNEDCNIAVMAGPGSGKTTVLKQLSKLTPVDKKSIFLAFNRSIVQELQNVLPSTVEVKTLHSLGISSLYKYYGRVKVVESKTFKTLKKLEKKWEKDLKEVKNRNYYFYNIAQLYDVYRMHLLNKVDEEVVRLGERFNLDITPPILKHLEILVKTMKRINRSSKSVMEIDYVDMIYLPVEQELPIDKYDRVFLDESQDLNICQHKLIDRILGRGSRLVSVGDPNQCIYSFLGADSRSFERFTERPNTVLLPLSISYRCPVSVVQKINSVYDVVETYKGAIQGEVRDGSFDEVEQGDMVLCRNNKPLLQGYFQLLKKGVKSYIRGAEYGKGLLKMVEGYKMFRVEACIEKLYQELDDLETRLANSGVKNPTKQKSFIRFSDNIELLKVVAEEYDKISEVIPLIAEIFKDNGEGVMLSTIHKAKGLEADRVFLVKPDLIPSKYAEQEWELEQENKLLFVAYSRPKKELVFVKEF
jgi:DNA helicase-2/ATP-dependent DNA helicase PcrA